MLAKNIVSEYHGPEKAEKARMEFEAVFAGKEVPENIPEFSIKGDRIGIIALIKEVGFTASASEARRLIVQNAVSVDDKKVKDVKEEIRLDRKAKILKVGKRRFARIIRIQE